MNFDVEGFTAFFNATSDKNVVESFITQVFGLFNTVIHSGMRDQPNAAYWAPPEPTETCSETIADHQLAVGKEPDDLKFMGDGAMYIWEFDTEGEVQAYALKLVKRLLCLQTNFAAITERFNHFQSLGAWRIRIGVASSPAIRYQVRTGPSGSKQRDEYVAHCLNLASRLQGFCKKDTSKNINLVVSASNALDYREFTLNGFTRRTVKKGLISDFPDEPVYLPQTQFDAFEGSHQLFN